MNKKVKAFIKQQTEIPRGNAQKDLAKFYADQQNEAPAGALASETTKKPRAYRWIWAVATALIVIAVILPTALLLTRPQAQRETGEVLHFCDDGDIRYETIDSVEAFNQKHQCNVNVRGDMLGVAVEEMYNTESNSLIGALVHLYVLDDVYLFAHVNCYTGNERIALSEYVLFTNETSVDGVAVEYSTGKGDGEYYYYLHWNSQEIAYYATVTTFQDISVSDAFNRFFATA
jgi:hypothetical protein